jgi:hypothetical protein
MKHLHGAGWRVILPASLICVVVTVALVGAAGGAASDPPEVLPTATLKTAPAHISVPDPAARNPQGKPPPFIPDIDPDVYRAYKEAANKGVAETPNDALAGDSVSVRSAPTVQTDVAGIPDTGLLAPVPDTDGAAGNTQYVQVVNSRVRVVSKSNPTSQVCPDFDLAQLAGTTEHVFDPNVIYDETWDRWALVFTRMSASNTDTNFHFFLAVSRTANACGNWNMYEPRTGLGGASLDAGDWFDYPHIGHDTDSLIVTGNIVDTRGLGQVKGKAVIPFAKAYAYNGLNLGGAPLFVQPTTVGTIQPPIFINHLRSRDAILLAAPPNGTSLKMYRLRESSRVGGARLLGPTSIDVTNYTIPPDAEQPGTSLNIDTFDNRFPNGHVQSEILPAGDAVVWQAHGVASGTQSKVRWYEIRVTPGGTPRVHQSGLVGGAVCSDDFNPSIAANERGEAVVTWSSTRDDQGTPPCATPSPGPAFPQMRTAGRQLGDPAGAMLGNIFVEGSATFWNDGVPPCRPNPCAERWGDYSDVSPDPTAPSGCGSLQRRRFWMTNENVPSATSPNSWGTRIAQAGFC